MRLLKYIAERNRPNVGSWLRQIAGISAQELFERVTLCAQVHRRRVDQEGQIAGFTVVCRGNRDVLSILRAERFAPPLG